ncbi:adenylate/guanylate cyclase domain-containing protein [Fulvivirga sediminis]|uniref:Adenylate/guanylate cyclase domain-containing protein n=1 Tax=Fulvivirga sediminis TaxID=2803949 RepID=A0A937FDM5_9BACT|nr:adenylate/guanylate cyclase domain-containing protein [Fulvivirga sediminis]MBL3658980.1 adenylate/guanylate cyclase domain-containing protein [Fulvivirga sediminis]
MEGLEEQAIQAFKNFWIQWGSRNDDENHDILTMVDHQFIGFGTNAHELWKNKTDLKYQRIREISQIADSYDYELNWVESQAMADHLALVCGEICLYVRIRLKMVVLEKIRNTIIFERKHNNELKIKHWHCSLPDQATEREVVSGTFLPKKYDNTSVFFCDFVGFTYLVEHVNPEILIAELNEIYHKFDQIMEEEEMEKIQVYGDGYLAVCGLQYNMPEHAIHCIAAGKKILNYLNTRNEKKELKWTAQIGVHSGSLVAGVVGEKKYSYNIFGDTVTTANRLETSSEPNKINISEPTYNLVKHAYSCRYRGKVEAKGKGLIDMFYVDL